MPYLCWIFDCLSIIHGNTIFCKSNFHKNRQANRRFIRKYFVMLDDIFFYSFDIMRCIIATLICTKFCIYFYLCSECECNMTLSRSCNKIVEKDKFHIALPLGIPTIHCRQFTVVKFTVVKFAVLYCEFYDGEFYDGELSRVNCRRILLMG